MCVKLELNDKSLNTTNDLSEDDLSTYIIYARVYAYIIVNLCVTYDLVMGHMILLFNYWLHSVYLCIT